MRTLTCAFDPVPYANCLVVVEILQCLFAMTFVTRILEVCHFWTSTPGRWGLRGVSLRIL